MQSLWPSLFGGLVDGQLYAMLVEQSCSSEGVWEANGVGGEEGAQGPLMDRSPGTNSLPLSPAS